MSLTTEWQARTSTARQVQLTNPDNNPASTVNATVLAAAVADATAKFYRVTGRTLVDTLPSHVEAAVPAVTYYLLSYGATPDVEYLRRARDAMLKALRDLVDLTPVTTSTLTPSAPDLSGGPVRPDFDRENLNPLVPRPATGGGTLPPGWR